MKYIESPYTIEMAEHFLLNAGLSNPPLVYAVEDAGTFVGYVIYHDYDYDSMEVGWVLKKEYWGHGFASNLTEQLIQKSECSNKGCVIECAPQQEVTKYIARKYGFQYTGKVDGLDVYRLKR